ncbi:MAG: hypothetical protein WA208_21560 [Thermoanaerobaculia bacterium]
MSAGTRDRGEGGDAQIAIDDLITQKVQVGGVYPNVEQKVILVTEDKVRLCLNANFQRAARSKQWLTVGGMILTFLLTLTTAQFRDFGGLSSQEWRGVMIAGLALSAFWFIVTIRWAANTPTIEDIVAELKAGSQQITNEQRVLSVGNEDVVVVQRRTAIDSFDEATGELHNWTNPLTSPIPEDTRKVLIIAMQTFRSALSATPNPGATFLARRGINELTRESLRLGYAPDHWDYLISKFGGIASAETLVTLGLAVERKAGSGYYDRFRNRLMVPVQFHGALVGFVGVSVEGIDPVLLLSPDGAFFNRRVALDFLSSSPQLRVIAGL